MTKETIEKMMELLTEAETVEFQFIWTVLATMEKRGYQCTCMRLEELVLFQEHPAHQKKLQLTFVAPTEAKSSLFSTYQDLEKLTQDYTKYSKRSKMDWYSTTDTRVDVVMSRELK